MDTRSKPASDEAATEGVVKRVAKAIGILILYVLVWLTLSIALMGLAKVAFGEFVASMDDAAEMAYEGAFMVLTVAIINIIAFYWFKSKLALAGWPGWRQSTRGFCTGSLIGLGMSAGMFILTVLMGGGEFSLDEGLWQEYFLRIIPLILFVFISTLGEEWFFRGYPMTVLAKATNPGWANLVMALLFALLHASSVGFNGLVALNIVVGSLVVGSLRFTEGGIPAAWGFHFAWNGLQVVAGSNLTGLELRVPMLHYNGKGADWLSGGALGPEGSVGATVATLIVLVLLTYYFRRRGVNNLPIPFGSRSGKTRLEIQ